MDPIDPKTHLMSDDIRALAQALLQALTTMGGAKKGSKSNRHKYADLTSVYEAVKESLYANNIFICHFGDRLDDGESVLHTRLIHAPTSQFIQDTRVLKSEKPGNQEIGSANTYMRRYAVLSLCALETEDDDGEGERQYIEKRTYAPAQVANTHRAVEALKPIPGKIIPEQLEQLQYELEGHSDICSTVLNGLQIDTLSEMPKEKFVQCIKRIQELKKIKELKTEASQ